MYEWRVERLASHLEVSFGWHAVSGKTGLSV